MCSYIVCTHIPKALAPSSTEAVLEGVLGRGCGRQEIVRAKAQIASRQKVFFGGKSASQTGHVARSLPLLPQLDLSPGRSSYEAKRAAAPQPQLAGGGGWRLAPAQPQHAVFFPT